MQSDIRNNSIIVFDSVARRRLASALNVSCMGPSNLQHECIEEGTYRAQRNSIKPNSPVSELAPARNNILVRFFFTIS